MGPVVETRILLIAGPVRAEGLAGHHDYAAGCALLADLLRRVPGIRPLVVHDGWPDDASLFEQVAAVVFYDNGGGHQGFLRNPARRAIVRAASDRGCGLTLLHQAAAFPADHAALGQTLVGGAYVAGVSRRGHWKSRHERFPDHPICQGVADWSARDGWLRAIRFTDHRRYVTPLAWVGTPDEHREQDIVAWAYEPPDRGRGFVFTGLDNHSAWQHAGLRQLIANGVLWSAGVHITGDYACPGLDAAAIAAYRTPRRLPIRRALGSFGRRLARACKGTRRKW